MSGLLHFPKMNGTHKGTVEQAIQETIRQQEAQQKYLLEHAPCLEAIQKLVQTNKALKLHMDKMMAVLAAVVEQNEGLCFVFDAQIEALQEGTKALSIERDEEADMIKLTLVEVEDGALDTTEAPDGEPGADGDPGGSGAS